MKKEETTHKKLTIEDQISQLIKNECSRSQEKIISGFYYTQSQYEGTNIEDEI